MPFTDAPTMLIGIDVYHQTVMKKKSIMAFVATMDKQFCQYFS